MHGTGGGDSCLTAAAAANCEGKKQPGSISARKGAVVRGGLVRLLVVRGTGPSGSKKRGEFLA
jgi:hypothetical protein